MNKGTETLQNEPEGLGLYGLIAHDIKAKRRRKNGCDASTHLLDGHIPAEAQVFPARAGAAYSQGLNTRTPVGLKCRSLRVTTTMSCSKAVAAMRMSASARPRSALHWPQRRATSVVMGRMRSP